jgi:hypothetical protein
MSATPYSPESMPPHYVLPPQKHTGMATASLVLGLLSILTVCICIGVPMGLIALILGIIAVANAASKPELYGGKGRAIAGIVTGSLSSVFLFVVGLVMWMTGLAAAVLSGAALQNVPFVASLTRTFSAVANMQRIAAGLSAYQAQFGVAPPSVEALVASGLIPASPFGTDPNDNPTAGAAWVADVTKKDPADWIVAYAAVDMLGQRQFLLLNAGGEIEHLDEMAFIARIERFSDEYEAARGAPPRFAGAAVDVDALASPPKD